MLNPNNRQPLAEANKNFNQKTYSIRARIKDVIRFFKRQFGFAKPPCKWIATNNTEVLSIGSTTLLGEVSLNGLIVEI